MGNYIFELDEQITRKTIRYKNRFGIELVADLYRPKDMDSDKLYPALVVGPPYSGVKEQGPGIYAQEMAKRGFISLAFDPSFNGFSGGNPRHVSSPDIFVEDFMAGVDYLGTRPFIDREKIGAIGICGSGSFALSAAKVDLRIKAVATASMVDISGAQQMGTKEDKQERLKQIVAQRYEDFTGDQPKLGPRGSALAQEETDPMTQEFGDFYFTPRGWHPNSITTFTLTSSLSFMNFSLLDHLEDISPRPIMLIAGENSFSQSFSKSAYQHSAEPHELIIVPKANHIDLYDRVDLIPFDKLENFFAQNLK
ncbi:alpha/beta hydrolase [Leuconostoc falkenbergense]|uniref:alpha/beta hydrolase n=1 Tax=Leuconostoc falkenbergense TaxID=2766470 RepID=UPI0024AC9339|nr:alpha/beta hydrolase [Leuconostoc falkenbergense]MDI6666709.1 alpha/beta hydrolase [Leuconostoc falkenbergense]